LTKEDKKLKPKYFPGNSLPASFIERGMEKFGRILRTTYIQWDSAKRRGLLQRLDPRLKILFLVSYAVLVTAKTDMTTQLLMSLIVLFLAVLSALNLVIFYGRVLFLGFIFGFAVALPSALNIFSDGNVILSIAKLSRSYSFLVYHIPAEIGLTDTGLISVLMLALRVINAVSLTFLVLFTTPFSETIRALKILRVPDSFLMVLALTYKYIFLFSKIVEDMHLARKSRTLFTANSSESRKWVAGRIALLFIKTRQRYEGIFQAMLARGFSGVLRLYGFSGLKASDWAAGLCFFLLGMIILWL
jgi:cobalt ECF transporter T component CbiQ